MALTTNLVSYYSFNAGNSNDSVGANNGTDTSMSYSGAAAKLGANGASFNGTTSKISTPSGIYSLFASTSSWTINMWVNFTSLAAQNTLYLGTDGTNTNAHTGVALYGDSPTGALTLFRGNGVTIDQVNGSFSFSTGTYYMITGTYDGTTLTLYVNSSTDGTPAVSVLTAVTNTSAYLGSRYGSTSFLSGNMDEVGVWSRALSSSEVIQLYNGGAGLAYPFSSTTPGNPMAYFYA